jgi:Tol biopolymer transport system component
MRFAWMLVAATVGCHFDPHFTCETDASCRPGGMCQLNGFCTFPDLTCRGGQRYEDYSGPNSGVCFDAPVPVDAGGDAVGTVDASLGPWTTPVKVPGASTNLNEDDATLSNDALEMIFATDDPNDANRKHLYTITRANAQTMTWTAPMRLSINVTGATDQAPELSENGLTLYFASNRTGTTGDLDIWQASRPGSGGAWGAPVLVPGVNSTQSEKAFSPCDNQRYLMTSGRGGVSEDVYEGVLGAGPPTLVSELSTAQSETGTFVTKDCRTTYFASNRSGQNMIYASTRSSPTAAWVTPVQVTDFASTGGAQEDPWLAPDGRTFVFSTIIGATNKDVYITTR